MQIINGIINHYSNLIILFTMMHQSWGDFFLQIAFLFY